MGRLKGFTAAIVALLLLLCLSSCKENDSSVYNQAEKLLSEGKYTEAAELLYEKARAYIALTPGSRVYDLYSGTGTIAQLLAPACGKVYGVEIVEEAVEAARGHAQKNGLTNCEFIAGPAEESGHLPEPELFA